jgi:DNA-binding NarL/FixJ family response regulator
VQSHAVLVVDDHPLMQTAIADTLFELVSSIHVQPAGSLGEALKQLSQAKFDLVVLDLALPDTVGFEGLKRLQRRHPEVRVVVCSGRFDYRTVYQALDLGASGFIPKSFGQYSIVEALRKVLSGNVYLPDMEGESIRRAMPAPSLPFAAESVEALELSPRQLDVLRLLVRGYPNKLICRQLELAEGTVKVHVSAVLAKLGARSRAEAIIAVSHLDLGTPSIRGSDDSRRSATVSSREPEATAPRCPQEPRERPEPH